MIIAPAQGVGMFEEGDTGIEVYVGVYAGATGKVLSMTQCKVWMQLEPFTGEAPCPYHVPHFCSVDMPQLVHIFLTSLNAPPAPPEMALPVDEGERICVCYGRYEGFKGSVVKVTEKMVKVRFDLIFDRKVRVRKTSIAILEDKEDGVSNLPVPFAVPAARGGPRVLVWVVEGVRAIPFAHLPIANVVSP
jgi:hypothetical protein